MIVVPAGVKVHLALGHTDMRKGLDGLATLIQEHLKKDPFSGHLFVFRGKNASLLKILFWDGTGLCLFTKRMDHGSFLWPRMAEPGGTVTLTPAQLAMLIEGMDWVRRETGRRQRVQVPYDEGVANHIDPESCVHGREVMGEALTRAHVGQPLSDERLPIRSADAFQSAESHMTWCVTASTGKLRVVCRPWHACTSSAREPGGLRTSLVSRMQGLMGKAEGRSP